VLATFVRNHANAIVACERRNILPQVVFVSTVDIVGT
jgi:hypothetical protein